MFDPMRLNAQLLTIPADAYAKVAVITCELEKKMQIGYIQELTLKTQSGVYHQAGIEYLEPGSHTPQLAVKAKAAVENSAVMYTRLAAPVGGPVAQFAELLERANGLVTKAGQDPIVEWFMHSGEELITQAEIQRAVGPSVKVTKLDD